MSEAHHSKYDDHMTHHSPQEGFDPTEPDSTSIFGFVVGSIILLVAVIFALQYYFDERWRSMVYDHVISVPSNSLATQRSLEDWRLSHYEFTDQSKSAVRLPLDRAKALLLQDAQAGKTFYPAKGTEPKPEAPPAPAGGAAPAEGKQEGKK